ncbi:MAG: tetratricopeptide repeat protein [Lachnospiraceae bacterium]|nr:tetratricopeptide repeat protein [Lachnospiraceae bacterium]
MKKNKRLLLLMIMLLIAFVVGCSHKEGENVKKGFAAIEQADYNNALQCFEQAIVSGEDLETAYRGMGMTYMGMADYENAIASFEYALDNAGIFAGDLERDINFYMATAYYKNGQFEEAVTLLDAIVESDKKSADAYYLRGIVKISMDDYEGCIYNFEKAMEYAKDSRSMKLDIYTVLADNGYEEKGRSYLMQLLDEEKNLSEYEQGVIYFYLQDYETARNLLETAKQAAKKDEKGEIVFMLGRTYEELDEHLYAGVMYSEYLSDNPNDAAVYNQLGLCKLQAKEPEAAIEAFETALALNDPAMTQTLKYNQIVAYEYVGDFAKANALMTEYLKAYPDDAEAQREAQFLRTR